MPSTLISDMKRKILWTILIVLSVILAALIGLVVYLSIYQQNLPVDSPETTASVPETQETTEPTTQPTEATTEPVKEPERFILTFVGDCTLGSNPKKFSSKTALVKVVGDNYDYPFENVRSYFENDAFTLVNLESVLADSGTSSGNLFTFRGPESYVNILTGSSVEAVTLANNHTLDFGEKGYKNTKTVLENAGVAYVEHENISLFTTDSGLVIGLYANAFELTEKRIEKNIQLLKDAGAEVIVCAYHWGNEGSYRPTAEQKKFAAFSISQGAHIVAGHHPHVLQPTESGENSVIFYSLGNFCFGGNTKPRDRDSVIAQVEIIRDIDGTILVGNVDMIPISISSAKNINNYQPILYQPDTKEYERTMEKLLGTFTGKDLVVNYDHLKDKNNTTQTPEQPETPEQSGTPEQETPKPPEPAQPAQ